MKDQVLVGVYGLSYSWRNPRLESGRAKVLDEISFELGKGEILALLGPNGSGKSTLLKTIAGILRLNRPGCSGQVRHLSLDFLSLPARRRAQKIAYVGPELRAEFPLTAEETVTLGRTCSSSGFFHRISLKDSEVVQWAMEQCLCWNLRKRSLESLSGGERQLVALARALAQGAQVLLLDEALSKMDLNHQAAMGSMLKGLARQGYGILLVSHDVNLASEWADSVLFLKAGKKLCQGPLRQTLTHENMKLIYPEANLVMGVNPSTGTPKVFFALSPT